MLLVGLDDVLHKLVPDDISFIEIDELDAVDVAKNLPYFDESGYTIRRKIDLRNVAGDHNFRVESQPSQKHFHLFRGSVLRFIENDERIVQGPTPHERQGCDFDVAPFDETRRPFHVHHVEQRIVERAQIRIDLRIHISRQETEFLTRLHCSPSENDSTDFFLEQRAHRHRHRQVSLAGSCRTDADDDVVLLDGLDVRLLHGRLRRHETLLGDDGRSGRKEFLDRSIGTVPKGGQCVGDVLGLEDHPIVGEGRQLGEDPFGMASGIGLSVERKLLSPCGETHAEFFFDELEVSVVVTEQNGGISTFSQFDLTHADAR